MILTENGEYTTDEESTEEQEENEEDPANDIPKSLTLVNRRSLSVLAKEDDDAQRKTIFQTRCFIKDMVCSLIIDGGSCTNVASTTLVDKLDLSMTNHPRPYKLHWLNDNGGVKVVQQVVVPFKIGIYEDKVLCDVVPMKAGHLLLGRPWQFDRKVSHNGFTNKYTFRHNHRDITLSPLSPKEIFKDQQQMCQESEVIIINK